jgi:hypothetical protein
MLLGAPLDRRLVSAYRAQADMFQDGVALMDVPGETIVIPYEDTVLPG